MQNALNSVKLERPKNNSFDLSHTVTLSCKMAELLPVCVMDVVPGDRVRIGCEQLTRLMPLVSPMMHRVDVSIHYFFVPNRIIWPDWERYITNGGDDPDGTTTPLPAHPWFYYRLTGGTGFMGYNKLMDVMGLPNPALGTQPEAEEKISALPFAAYQKIYNEYYRDENLIDSVVDQCVSGQNSVEDMFALRKRAWEADYFTKALPFAQKGNAVDIPLGDVELKAPYTGMEQLVRNQDGTLSAPDTLEILSGSEFGKTAAGPLEIPTLLDPNGTLTVDATTINDLRLAFRLQEWLEKNARGGTRYSELIRAHFGVTSPDARLQRPEYITGIKTPIQISEVLNTSGEGDLPQGNMAGHGVGFASGNYGKYFATEHGYIIGIMSVMPKTVYMQGIPKHFLKYTSPTELFWPSFAHLGEQEVQNKEIFAFQGSAGAETFGYQSRYMEYKNIPNRVCTEMRTSLDFWNMARKFTSIPALNGTFVTADPTTRVFAVTGDEDDNLVCTVMNKIMAVRPMPVYGTPTF